MKKITKIGLIFAALILTNHLSAQVSDTVASQCEKHLANMFISDGQQYRALLLNADETAEFHTTLFGGTVYRIAACTGFADGNLTFSVYDKDRNLLFKSSDYNNHPYWDFKINNTIDCLIEAKLIGRAQGSGRAVILIGFKPQQGQKP